MTLTATAPSRLTTTAVQQFTGLTYRQLDYWCRTRVLGDLTPMAGGSGSHRVWNYDQVHALTVCRRVAACLGVATTGAASRPMSTSVLRLVAERLAASGWPTSGYLLASAEACIHAADVTGVIALLDAGNVWTVCPLFDTDRP